MQCSAGNVLFCLFFINSSTQFHELVICKAVFIHRGSSIKIYNA